MNGQAQQAEGADSARRAALAGHMAMALFSALVAGSFSLGGMIAGEVAPGALMALRFVLGAAVLAGLALALGRGRQLLLPAPWRFAILGPVFAAYFVAMFAALRLSDPVTLAAIFTLTPLVAAGFARPILGQRTPPAVLAALLLGAVGALWVIFRADPGALLRLDLGLGEAIFFAGTLAHGAYVPLLRRLDRGEGALASTFGVLTGGALVLVAWAWRELAATDWGSLPPLVWWVLAYLVVFTTIITFSLVQFASLRLPAAKVMAYTYLTPSWVILWELALGHGAPPLVVLGGVGLTLAALALLLGRD